MNEMKKYVTSEPVGCEPIRITIIQREETTGKMLQEALMIVYEINQEVFGEALLEGERPISKCLEHSMELNGIGMRSLLDGLNALRNRLY